MGRMFGFGGGGSSNDGPQSPVSSSPSRSRSRSLTQVKNVRVLVLGDSGVGKSTLVHLLCEKQVNTALSYTIGCTVGALLHSGRGSSETFVEFVDVGAANAYACARSVFYQEPFHGLILVHDLTNKRSNANLRQWVAEVVGSSAYSWEEDVGGSLAASASAHKLVLRSANRTIPTLFIGCKKDLWSPGSCSLPNSSTPVIANDQLLVVRHHNPSPSLPSLPCSSSLLPLTTLRAPMMRIASYSAHWRVTSCAPSSNTSSDSSPRRSHQPPPPHSTPPPPCHRSGTTHAPAERSPRRTRSPISATRLPREARQSPPGCSRLAVKQPISSPSTVHCSRAKASRHPFFPNRRRTQRQPPRRWNDKLSRSESNITLIPDCLSRRAHTCKPPRRSSTSVGMILFPRCMTGVLWCHSSHKTPRACFKII